MASLATSLPPMVLGCSEKEARFRGSGALPYKIWEEILHELKTSPDHLKGQMERLIVEGNPEAMFHFVRDQIYLMPMTQKSIGRTDATKWGVDYALRSGMATAMEKAELLQRMYNKADIPAKIVWEHTNISPEEVPTFFFRPTERPFSPNISDRTLMQWGVEMGMENMEYQPDVIFEDELELANELGGKIWNTLDLKEDYKYRGFDFRWDNSRTPTVEFQWEGNTRYAHLIDPKVPYGKLRNQQNKVSEAGLPKPNEEKVTIKLTYRDSIKPLEEKELIGNEWLASDLVGRQVDVMFLNNLSPQELRITPIANIRTFTPALGLQAIGKSEDYMSERSILANPITLEGKRFQLDKGNSIAMPLLDKSDPNLQKQVKTITATATTTGYPGVKLSISPKDASGNLVEGLSASDFTIVEDGKPVRAVMETNQRTPKILIMADVSMSMPTEYRNEGMVQFINELKSNILGQYPAAIVQYWETPSALYTWLLKGSQTDNDLIIFATDGDNNDDFDPKNEDLYKSGPPAIILNVYNTSNARRTKTFDHMAQLTKGLHLAVEDQKAALTGIEAYLKNLQIQPYTFTYWSAGTLNERNVSIGVDNNKVLGKATYQFKSIVAPTSIGPRIIGLYLYINYAGHRVYRVLAGWQPTIERHKAPTQQMANDVNDLMLGGIQLYFEGGGPTFSSALSDLLEAKLSTRKWGEALLNNQVKEAEKALANGQLNISGSALTLMAPLSNAVTKNSFTFPSGLRMGMQTLKPGFITGTYHSLFDYLQTSQYTTLGRNPEQNFKTTLLKTAQMAIRESKMYHTCTLTELSDKLWTNLLTARKNNWLSGVSKDEFPYWRERIDRAATLRIFDKNLQSKAFWDVNKTTGELYGILYNGSGGASDDAKNDADKLGNLYTALSNLIAIMEKLSGVGVLNPIGGFALSVVAMYGQTLVRLYGIVSETIMIMDTSGMDDKIRAELAQFACNVAKEVVYATTGEAGEIMSGLDNLIGMVAPESSPFPCN